MFKKSTLAVLHITDLKQEPIQGELQYTKTPILILVFIALLIKGKTNLRIQCFKYCAHQLMKKVTYLYCSNILSNNISCIYTRM